MNAGQVNFTVVGETRDLLVIDKPAGLLVHPTKPGGPPTLWDGLRELLAFELVNGGQVSLINRLDRETSGVVLVCKTSAAARQCAMAMERGRIRKQYAAVVWGWPVAEEFEVDAPLLRLGEVAESRVWLKRAVHAGGAAALTRFRVERRIERADGTRLAFVRAWPVTGRTHQIRVHLAHAGHPVVGDKLYGPDERHYLDFIDLGWTPEMERALLLPRHALHSEMIDVALDGITHRWIAPVPEEMLDLLDAREAA
ncbi:MAG: RluA family pseudouridine synthase [Terrimicrobiaceae bacterium]|nr:RluA family pseudouridine synthase [Terrimicrobiaceae bacterium]